MQVSTGSWHYRWVMQARSWFGTNEIKWEAPKSLCEYIRWMTIWPLLCIGGITGGVLAFVGSIIILCALVPPLTMLFLAMLADTIGEGLTDTLVVIILMAPFIIWEWRSHRDHERISLPSPIIEYAHAAHRGICPLMEYV